MPACYSQRYPATPPGPDAAHPVYPFAGQGHYGPWKHGGNLYAYLGNADNEGTGQMYKSTDEGWTWAIQDYKPALWNGLIAYDPPHNRVVLLHRFADAEESRLELVDFNLDTDTWSEPYAFVDWSTDSGFAITTGTLCIRANGDIVPVAEEANSPWHIRYAIWDGSGWTFPPTDISDNIPTSTGRAWFRDARCDPDSDNIHVVYERSTTIPSTSWTGYHRVLKGDGTLSTPVVITSHTGTYAEQIGTGVAITFQGGQVHLWVRKNFLVKVLNGTLPVPASFTEITVADASGSFGWLTEYTDVSGFASADGTKLTALWTRGGPNPGYHYDRGATQVWKSESADDGATWSTPVLFFDRWPSDMRLSEWSVTDIGTGGVEGVGAFCTTETNGVAEFLFQCPEGAPALSNYAF